MSDNIKTRDRDGNALNIAALERSAVQFPLNHLMDAAGATINPATETTLAALLVATTTPAPVGLADGANLDAFSRLRVSEPSGLFASQAQYDAEPLLYEGGATGDGTAPAHNANTRMVALATAGTGTSFLQSYEYIPYQPGKSQLVIVTGLFGAGVAGAVVDTGIFDAANGFFMRQNGASGMQLVRRTSTSGSVVDEVVEQADWSEDPFDGTGPSGVTLDPTKVHIIAFDAQFLGMGRCRVWLDVDGLLLPVHQFLHANILAVPYMQSLTLPIQTLVTSTAATKTAFFKCAAVSSEGGFADDLGYAFSTPEGLVTAASGARTAILSMRPKTTFNALVNRIRLRVNEVAIVVTGSNPILWELCVGSTWSVAPTFGDVSASSSAEYSTAPGTLAAAGLVVASGYVAASNQTKNSQAPQITSRYPITLDRAGAVRANGTLTLVITGLGQTSATRAMFNFSEVR